MIGRILQVRCWKYLKDHPELFSNQNPVTKSKKCGLRHFLPFIEFTGAKLVVNIVGIITYIAQNGTGIVITKIPAGAISTYVRNALLHKHTDW